MTDNTIKLIGAAVLADIIFNDGKLTALVIDIAMKQPQSQKRIITAKRLK